MPVTFSDTLIFYDFLFLRALDRTIPGRYSRLIQAEIIRSYSAFLLLHRTAPRPVGRLLLNSTGNIYGVTCCGGTNDYGVLFSLTPAGEQTVLHKFTGGADDGAAPYSSVIFGPEKSLYGATQYGGWAQAN